MSKDVKFINACNHKVGDKTYDLELCPKCYGKGWYFDICFDKAGDTITSSDEIKLQQEMLKVIIDHKYFNLFHQEWGSQLHTLIGNKNNTMTQNRLKLLARQAEEYLQKIQYLEYKENNTLNNKEMIDEIISVNVKPAGATGYIISIIIKNGSGEVYEQSLQL